MHAIEIECDECGMSFPEDCLVMEGSSTLCKWCYDSHRRKQLEDEDKLTYEGIARFMHRMREAFPEDDDDDDENED